MSLIEQPAPYHEISGGAGDLPALVLLNSLGANVRMWDAVVEGLSREFRILRMDYRGHGRTPYDGRPFDFDDMVADVIGMLDEEGIEGAHVAGVSLGGMLAIALGARHPGRVRSVAPMCCGAHLSPQDWHERAKLVREQGMGVLADVVTPRWFTTAARTAQPGLVAAHLYELLRCDPEGYAAHSEILATVDLREELAAVEVPTVVVAAADDVATPPALQREIADAVPGGRLRVVPNAAHMIVAEAADAVAAIVREHAVASR